MISIGYDLFGPELDKSSIDLALSTGMKIATELRGNFEFGSSPAVNVVFHVPGSISSPDWEWLRDAKFSRRDQLLMVQVAVPEEVVESSHPEKFIIDSLYGANAVAFEFYRQKGIDYPLADAEQLVEEIEKRLTASRQSMNTTA